VARLASAFLLVVFAVTVEAAAGQAAPYKIVVLAGEDSVNVIQQKTAVAPLVEVRDRNNQPVSGVVVTFAVQGGKAAAFQGGASTLTIATNAAGQAAATGLTPLAAGAVNISVEAAVQGQVITAAISQVNVMTVAEAAAAAGTATGASSGTGTAGGGAAAGGGGISGTTIGIIGGVAAAGAVAATQVGGGGGDEQSVYRSAFSMNVTLPFGNCARQENYSGTLELRLDSITGTITGRAEIMDGRGTVTATTCPGPITAGPIGAGWGMPEGPVSGTESSIAFHTSDVVPTIQNDGTTIARTFDFIGSMSGTTIPGEIHMVWRNSQPNFPLMDMRTNVTLTRQ
jgi:hypothetical protein